MGFCPVRHPQPSLGNTRPAAVLSDLRWQSDIKDIKPCFWNVFLAYWSCLKKHGNSTHICKSSDTSWGEAMQLYFFRTEHLRIYFFFLQKCEKKLIKPFGLAPPPRSPVGVYRRLHWHMLWCDTPRHVPLSPRACLREGGGVLWWESNGTVCTPLLAYEPLLTPINTERVCESLRQQAAALRPWHLTDVTFQPENIKHLPSPDFLLISLIFKVNTWSSPLWALIIWWNFKL